MNIFFRCIFRQISIVHIIIRIYAKMILSLSSFFHLFLDFSLFLLLIVCKIVAYFLPRNFVTFYLLSIYYIGYISNCHRKKSLKKTPIIYIYMCVNVFMYIHKVSLTGYRCCSFRLYILE